VIGTQTASMLLAFALAGLTLTKTVLRLACFRAGVVARCGERFRHPGAPVVSGGDGGQGDLNDAIALNSSMFNASRIIGPAIAGILVAAIAKAGAFSPTP